MTEELVVDAHIDEHSVIESPHRSTGHDLDFAGAPEGIDRSLTL